MAGGSATMALVQLDIHVGEWATLQKITMKPPIHLKVIIGNISVRDGLVALLEVGTDSMWGENRKCQSLQHILVI